MTPDEVLQYAKNSKVIIAGVEEYSSVTLEKLPYLECISRCGSGVDSIDLHHAKNAKISILNTPEEPVNAVAELTLTMILGLLKKLPSVNADTHNRLWKRSTGKLLKYKTVGIMGFGRIGKQVATLLKPFGVNILIYDPLIKNITGQNIIQSEKFENFLSSSDIITIHCSEIGKNTFGKNEIKLMKKGSYLLNLARGSFVEERALLKSIKDKHLSGAALDVYTEEPYYGEMCDCDEIIMFPHQATLTDETRNEMEIKSTSNAIAYLKKHCI